MFQKKVEFLPLLPILLPTTLGILSYRLWFSHSMQGAPGSKGASRPPALQGYQMPTHLDSNFISQHTAVSLIICRDKRREINMQLRSDPAATFGRKLSCFSLMGSFPQLSASLKWKTGVQPFPSILTVSHTSV